MVGLFFLRFNIGRSNLVTRMNHVSYFTHTNTSRGLVGQRTMMCNRRRGSGVRIIHYVLPSTQPSKQYKSRRLQKRLHRHSGSIHVGPKSGPTVTGERHNSCRFLNSSNRHSGTTHAGSTRARTVTTRAEHRHNSRRFRRGPNRQNSTS